jgi:nucleoside-diphosphate-sugar epimerase
MRPSMMLGPGDVRLRSTLTVYLFLKRKIPFTPSRGVSFVDVRDVARAFKTAMERGESEETME